LVRKPSGAPDVCSKCLEQNGFEKVAPENPPLFDDSKRFLKKVYPSTVPQDVTVFVLDSKDTYGAEISHYDAFMTHGKQEEDELVFFIEAPNTFTPSTKASFVNVLELAEELGCTNVFLILDKNTVDLNGLLRSYSYLGFSLVHPDVMKIDGCIVLGYVI